MRLIALLLISSTAFAECKMAQDTVAVSTADIAKRQVVAKQVFDTPTGKVCSVDMRFLIGSEWHAAVGEASWSPDITQSQACGTAVSRAEQMVLDRAGKMQLQATQILTCNDDAPHTQHPIGSVASLTAYRGHPEYPRSFVHNGTECRFFLDSQFTGADVYTYQGIICRVNGGWAVVDKF